MKRLAPALIWLLVITLGVTVGAGLYEGRIVAPLWARTPPPAWINAGPSFWAFVSTGPLTLVVLVGLVVIRRFDGPSRPWWLAALCVALVERIATFAYFIPTMVSLQQQQALTPEVVSTLATWSFANHGRHILTIAAWLSSLKALSLLGVAGKRS